MHPNYTNVHGTFMLELLPYLSHFHHVSLQHIRFPFIRELSTSVSLVKSSLSLFNHIANSVGGCKRLQADRVHSRSRLSHHSISRNSLIEPHPTSVNDHPIRVQL